MHIAYYITGHGYGHAIRSSTIANALSPTVRLTFKTSMPVSFFQEELHRPFNYCGCLQTDGVSVDIPATLSAYRTIAENNRRLLDTEVEWCRRHGADGMGRGSAVVIRSISVPRLGDGIATGERS